MNRNFLRILLACGCAFFCLPRASAAPEDGTRYLIVITDRGGKGLPQDVVAYAAAHPEIRLTTTVPAEEKPSAEFLDLARAGRIETALTIADEPVLPLLYRTVLSTSTSLVFSWPGDAWNIVMRSQEDLKTRFPSGSRGLYLRSGVFDTELISGLKPLGVRWAAYRGTDGSQAVSIVDDFLLLPVPAEFADGAAGFAAAVDASSAPVTVILFGEKNPISVPMLEQLGAFLRVKKAIVMVTPEFLLEKGRAGLPVGAGPVQADLSSWLRRPAVLGRIAAARTAIEEYNNSGQAQLKILAQLRDEMYALYRFDLLQRLNENPQVEDEQLFLAHLRNIYMLLKRPLPDGFEGRTDAWQGEENGGAQSFAVTLSSRCLTVVNAVSPAGSPSLVRFSVQLTTEAIVFSVELTDDLPAVPWAVDIYMDLNNQRGAGLANLFGGLNAFMEPRDAWEFALRIENGQASLYRAGRFEPVPVKKFASAKKPLTVSIPRSALRGNPLGWGYQTVLLEQNGATSKIDDFLCPDEVVKKKILEQATVQLPALRARPSMAEVR